MFFKTFYIIHHTKKTVCFPIIIIQFASTDWLYNGPYNEGLIPIRLLSYRFGLAGLEYLNHKCVCFLPWSQS